MGSQSCLASYAACRPAAARLLGLTHEPLCPRRRSRSQQDTPKRHLALARRGPPCTYTRLTLKLQEAIEYTAQDLAYTNKTIQASLDRFQRIKVQDIKQLMLDLARMQRAYCSKSLDAWREARDQIEHIDDATWEHMPAARLSASTHDRT